MDVTITQLAAQPAFAYIGLATAVYVLIVVLRWLFAHCMPSFLCGANLKTYGAKKGAWAVVTGASDGIGKGVARALAARGMNVVLVSRTAAKLDAVAKEIKDKYSKCETKCVAVDVGAANTKAVVQTVVDGVQGLNVTMLINNVGVNTDGGFPAELSDHSEQEVENMVRVNCLFTTLLTRAFVPILKKNVSPRSAIVNLGSISSLFPMAMMPVYAATKAFDGTGLHKELSR
jgi:17beta-estradiol 17-dehydrogenase / very-long-chain 3-oxoacyl-CoA reductase